MIKSRLAIRGQDQRLSRERPFKTKTRLDNVSCRRTLFIGLTRRWGFSPLPLALSRRQRPLALVLNSPRKFHVDMLGLDRKQMEAERLARLAKKRGTEDQPEPTAAQPRKIRRTSPTPTPTSGRNHSITPPPRRAPQPFETSASNSTPLPTCIVYPYGAIKRTWCFRQPRDGTDIKLEEVLEKSTLSIAVISSWQLNTQYLFGKLGMPQNNVRLYLIMHAKHPSDQETWRRDAAELSPNIRLCFPKLSAGPSGIMHSKLMLLFHPDKLRVVVPSANMMHYDWGETGVMENVVFLVDLPRLPADRQGHENDTLTPFALDLLEYIEAQDVDQDVRDGVLKFEFSRTGQLAFANTIAGTHVEEDVPRTGFPQLAAAVRSLGCATTPGDTVEIDFAASSIGKLDTRIFSDLCRAFKGIGPSPETPATEPSGDFRIHFPSLHTVRSSTGGPDSAGTLFFAPQKVDDSTAHLFAKMRDAQSTREGLLSHAKMAIVRNRTGAFAYVGSANASQAAWGKLTQGKKKGSEMKLSASNWECGVVVKLDVEGETEDGKVIPLEKVQGKVPLMFRIPGEAYVKDGKVTKPWMVTSR